MAGVEIDLKTDGLDLSRLFAGREEASFTTRALYGEASGGLTYDLMMEGIFPVYRSLRRGDHKLIHNSKTQHWALYDLAADPGETRDIAEQRPELVEQLASEMKERYKDFDPAPLPSNRIELDEQELERLRALGYLP